MNDSKHKKTPLESAYMELLGAIQLFNDFLSSPDLQEPDFILERLTCYWQAQCGFILMRKRIRAIPNFLDDIWLREIQLHLVLLENDLPELPAYDTPEFRELATPEFYDILLGAAKDLAQKHYREIKIALVKLGILWRDELGSDSSSSPSQIHKSRNQLFQIAQRFHPDLDETRFRGMVNRAKQAGVLINEGTNRWLDCGWKDYAKKYQPRRSPDGID